MAERIEIGQRFRENGRPFVWEVQAVFDRPGEPAHVRLVKSGDPHRLKTIGLSTLMNKSMYEAVR